MEMNILHAIQALHNPELDKFMVLIFSTIVGDKGQFWVYIGVLALLFKKTRKCGVAILASYLLSYVLCDNFLKEMIARPRPCAVDESIELIIKRSSSYSCPSVHSALAFACSMSIYLYNKKIGVVALVFAALVAFSRLYFFVHYPSDVLLGAVIGALIAYILHKLVIKKI